MATNRFYSKTKLAAGSHERQTLKRSCIALYSVAMAQIPRSTERISSYFISVPFILLYFA